MLISLLLTLTPDAPATLPADLGRAVQAETLARLAQVDPALAATLHAGNGPKPLTCSGLIAADTAAEPRQRHPADNAPMRVGSRYFVRLTGLTGPVSEALWSGFVEQPPAAWTLHGATFHVLKVICDPEADPWTGRADYEALAAAALRDADRLPRAVTLEFVSPTAFKSQEMQIPIPLPGLVFGSLVEGAKGR